MADSRLPDVVPAADVHLSIPTAVTIDSVSNTLICIWPEEKEGKEEKEEEGVISLVLIPESIRCFPVPSTIPKPEKFNQRNCAEERISKCPKLLNAIL